MTNWTTGICEANGINIHYLRTGGSKPPVVLLHGLTGSGACWSLLARALEGEYDVVMPDARAHGNSSTPLNGYRYENLAGDVIGLIVGLGLTAPGVLGHSMGGMTAAVVASRLTTAIRGVILVDPTFLSPQRQREVYESDVVEQHQRLISLGEREALAQARVRHAHRRPEIVELVTEARLKTRIGAFDILTPPNPEYHQLVSTICVPILLVIGEFSSIKRYGPEMPLASLVRSGLANVAARRFAVMETKLRLRSALSLASMPGNRLPQIPKNLEVHLPPTVSIQVLNDYRPQLLPPTRVNSNPGPPDPENDFLLSQNSFAIACHGLPIGIGPELPGPGSSIQQFIGRENHQRLLCRF
jgi:pimeloyl-ACP methyl ester carboxylesterase